MVRPEKANQYFPVLDLIPEEDKQENAEISKIPADDSDNEHEDVVDPDDAEAPVPEPGWEDNNDNGYAFPTKS
ncbi:hypothetical protein PtB15_6B285 [Puccinia triticina]|nr:hypothetical protein PtB15_6B285 [Puccinia triticina]